MLFAANARRVRMTLLMLLMRHNVLMMCGSRPKTVIDPNTSLIMLLITSMSSTINFCVSAKPDSTRLSLNALLIAHMRLVTQTSYYRYIVGRWWICRFYCTARAQTAQSDGMKECKRKRKLHNINSEVVFCDIKSISLLHRTIKWW